MNANTNTPAPKATPVAVPTIVFFADEDGTLLFMKEYKTERAAKGILTKMKKPTYKNEAILGYTAAGFINTGSLGDATATADIAPETVRQLNMVFNGTI
jgi:hypothetical protein